MNENAATKSRSGSITGRARVRARRGLGLLEAAFGLTLMSVAAAGLFGIVNDQAMNQKASVAAERLVEIGNAAEEYIDANREKIWDATAGGQVRIPIARRDRGDPIPLDVTANGVRLLSLQESGFLPQTFIDRNAFGTSHTLVVRRSGQHVVGLVSTLEPPNRQGNMSNRTLGRIVAKAGARAGMYMTSGTDRSGTAQSHAGDRWNNWVQGASGGWNALASEYTADGEGPTMGSAAMMVTSGGNSVAGDFLNRRDVGNPEANRMRTTLRMGRNAISEATVIEAPVTSTADLTPVTTANDPSGVAVNTVRVSPNMHVDWNASVGQNFAVGNDASVGQNLSVGNDATAGRHIRAGSNVYAGGDVIATRHAEIGGTANVSGDVLVGGGVYSQGVLRSETNGFVKGTMRAEQSVVTPTVIGINRDTKQVTRDASQTALYYDQDGDNYDDDDPGATVPLNIYRMSPDGLTNLNILDANILSVNPLIADGPVVDLTKPRPPGSNRFPRNGGIRLKDMLPEYVLKASYQAYPGRQVVPKPVCAGQGPYKGVPKIILTPMADSFQMPSSLTLSSVRDAADNVTINADLRTSNSQYTWNARPFATVWEVQRGGNANIPGRPWRALAQTYCYYGDA